MHLSPARPPPPRPLTHPRRNFIDPNDFLADVLSLLAVNRLHQQQSEAEERLQREAGKRQARTRGAHATVESTALCRVLTRLCILLVRAALTKGCALLSCEMAGCRGASWRSCRTS